MYWNHRVVQYRNDLDGDPYYEIVECHYNDDGGIVGYTEGVSVGGDSVAELYESLEYMKRALDKPVLVDGEVIFEDDEAGVGEGA